MLLLLFALNCKATMAEDFVWFDGRNNITYNIESEVSPVVKTALQMFADDMHEVTGLCPQQSEASTSTIRMFKLTDKNQDFLRTQKISIDSISFRRDAFIVKVVKVKHHQYQLFVVGSDDIGLAYGILELSRLADVSPWRWWADVVPAKRSKLALHCSFQTIQYPSVEYRGIFINDEDWGFVPWSTQTFTPISVKGYIGVNAYRQVFKLLLRLRANIIWPAMHDCSVPFFEIDGAKEAADSCGIVIGTSHCEPLMRNNVGEWNVAERGQFNYITNKESVTSYWIERLKQVANNENYFTLGMRGIHDGSMEGVNTLDEKTAALQHVIDDQRVLLSTYIDSNLSSIPQVFVPYKEVLQILENGLVIPSDVTLMWCDDNYGYLTRLSDTQQQKRSGGAGIYYHVSYWGRPHDYLWLSTTQPGLIYNQMRMAYNSNVRKLWILNVGDIKPCEYNIELFLNMAWNINCVSENTLDDYMYQWLNREFGAEAASRLLPAMREYYRLNAIRRPEFMGWSQVEVQGFPRRLTPITNTEFSQTEFGNEANRRLNDFNLMTKLMFEAKPFVPKGREAAFFELIEYPFLASKAMNVKWIMAQRAAELADSSTVEYADAYYQSINAYDDIIRLTDRYNNLLNGKWNKMMDMNPRNLPVFARPQLPKPLLKSNPDSNYLRAKPISLDSCITSNACDYSSSAGTVGTTQQLGHSMNAVAVAKQSSITFDVYIPWSGNATLSTALIPTHPNDNGDIRFSVSIDSEKPQECSIKEEFRSEPWKKNVLRQQVIRKTSHFVTTGQHKITFTALDNNIVFDQWMLDFKPNRAFYQIPIVQPY